MNDVQAAQAANALEVTRDVSMMLEEPPCPLCASVRRVLLYDVEPYGVVRCRACGCQYLSPRPTAAGLRRIYESPGYYAGESFGYADYAAQAPALQATFQRLLRQLQRQGVTGGDLLEIGCGHGYLLEAAQPWFARRVGTDYAAFAVADARARATAVYQGGVEQLPDSERFDCIIAVHVIEHVCEPVPFARRLRHYLRPGGALVLATPDAGSWWRVMMGRRWPSFKIPEHVVYLNARTLLSVMEQAGFTAVRLVPYWHAFPLSLVAAKLGRRAPSALQRLIIWLPGTTVAAVGRTHA